MMDWLQRDIYEALAFLGPVTSALLVGFAAVSYDGEIRLTAAGERYLETIDQGCFA